MSVGLGIRLAQFLVPVVVVFACIGATAQPGSSDASTARPLKNPKNPSSWENADILETPLGRSQRTRVVDHVQSLIENGDFYAELKTVFMWIYHNDGGTGDDLICAMVVGVLPSKRDIRTFSFSTHRLKSGEILGWGNDANYKCRLRQSIVDEIIADRLQRRPDGTVRIR